MIGAVAYSLLLARTTPFTTSADVVTGIPLILFVVAMVLRRPARPTLALTPTPARRWPWVVLLVVTAGWELWSYLATGSRAEYPTFSSMTDAVDRTWGLKAVVVLAWLMLGWAIVSLHRLKGDPAPR